MNSRISYAPGWPGSEPRWTSSAKTGLGTALHIADLPTNALAAGSTIRFAFHWTEAGRWEGTDFAVGVFAGTRHLPAIS